jgi:hypothetical protein
MERGRSGSGGGVRDWLTVSSLLLDVDEAAPGEERQGQSVRPRGAGTGPTEGEENEGPLQVLPAEMAPGAGAAGAPGGARTHNLELKRLSLYH